MCERDGEKGGSNQGARDRERERRIGGRDGRNGGYCERDESRGKRTEQRVRWTEGEMEGIELRCVKDWVRKGP